MPSRSLNAYEVEVFRRALGQVRGGVELSHVCLASAEDVAAQDKDWHHIRLSYPDATKKGSDYSIIADWIAHDLDGAVMALLILGDRDGRPFELQIQRLDRQPILHLPSIDC